MRFGKSINRALGKAAQSYVDQKKRESFYSQLAADANKRKLQGEKNLIAALQYHDKRYENGKEIISDSVYDKFKEELRVRFPNNPYFKESAKTNTTPNPSAVNEPKLPMPMPGLTKLRPDSALAWATSLDPKLEFVYADEKIDGIACMLKFTDGVLVSAQKKSDADHGRDIMDFVKYVKSVPTKLDWKFRNKLDFPITLRGDIVVRGELAVSFEAWKPYGKEAIGKEGYAHPRVMAAGLFNAAKPDLYVSKTIAETVDFIACNIAWPEQADPGRNKTILQNLFPTVMHGTRLSLADVTPENMVKQIRAAKDESPYPCDGIVLSASDGGEIYRVAVKLETADQTSVKTVVERVEYNMSARNLLKPTILIKPVVIDGIEVSRLTGNNAKQINDYKIGPESVVWVVRAGDVVPHTLLTGKFKPSPSKHYRLESSCPGCGSKLSWTMTANGKPGADLQCMDKLCLESKRTATFLERISVKGLGETHIQNLSLDRSVEDVLRMKPEEISEVLGDKTGKTVHVNLHNAMRKSLAHVMYASGMFTTGTMSLGAATLAEILTHLNQNGHTNTAIVNCTLSASDVTRRQLQSVLPPTHTSYLFTDRLLEFRLFYHTIKQWHQPPRQSDEMSGIVICFSGFRDPNLVDKIRSKGGVYSDSLTRKTTHLVSLTEPHPTKLAKAKELGVKCIRATSLYEMLNDPDYDGKEFSGKPEKARTWTKEERAAPWNPGLSKKTVVDAKTKALLDLNPALVKKINDPKHIEEPLSMLFTDIKTGCASQASRRVNYRKGQGFKNGAR
jgi:DNA ligase (NAD+)